MLGKKIWNTDAHLTSGKKMLLPEQQHRKKQKSNQIYKITVKQ